MARHLDVEKVRAALKSAAKKAVSGPRELRSGRLTARDARTGQFLPKPSSEAPQPSGIAEKSTKP
jgi:hypothetical protein